MRQGIADSQYRKIPIGGFYRICKDLFIIGWRPEPIQIGEAKVFRRQLNGQRSAAFCSARIDDFTTANSSHSGAEAMSSDAFDFAGLIGSFHWILPY